MTGESVTQGKRRVEVLGHSMAYVDEGSGPPILLLHGNPTSSYVWRNVIPHLDDVGRCVAPDLIGMGDSDKLEGSGAASYRFVEHRRFLEAFLERLGLEHELLLVLHDWGAALGFDWARRHPDAVRGIAYMEGIVRPLRWEEWPKEGRSIFEAMRSPAGEELVLDQNVFVERILPASVLIELSEETMAEYRRPFSKPGEDRRPTLTWPRELPIDGQPADVVEIVDEYSRWLHRSRLPKLFVNGEPGSILVGAQRETCRSWPNQSETTVRGVHFVQEDSAAEIGRAVRGWIRSLPG